MDTVADCKHCGNTFEIDGDLAGGITNCPSCGKATEVQGLRDPIWRLAQAGGLAVAIVVGVAVGYAANSYDGTGGWAEGITAGGITALALFLISRAF